MVEAAATDLIGRPPLTNVMAGHHDSSFGRITSRDVITMLTAKPVVVREKTILITINQLYRSGMSPTPEYRAPVACWSPRAARLGGAILWWERRGKSAVGDER